MDFLLYVFAPLTTILIISGFFADRHFEKTRLTLTNELKEFGEEFDADIKRFM